MTPAILMIAGVALAQDPAASTAEPDLPPPGVPPAPDHVDELTRQIAAKLRCPVCQGLSVQDSPSPTAVEMKGRIRDLVAKGYDEPQIIDYFVARYGDWVLLQPTFAGHWLVWLGPGLVLGVGLAWVASTVVRWRKEPEPLPSDLGQLPKDQYEERLLREIDE